jgi:arylsulfatase
MENAAMAEVLREKGWNTFWVGKNHNVPVDEWAMGATKRNWPLARGFDRFIGDDVYLDVERDFAAALARD